MASIIPTRTRSWHHGVAVVALLAFVFLACYRLDVPGLYADEMIFGPAALRVLHQCDVPAGVNAHVGKCFPTYLEPPYLGALKAWIHAPIIKAFGANPWSLRVPSVLLAALALWIVYRAQRRIGGAGLATATIVVLAFDPTIVFHSHFDWGPCVISALARVGLLALILRWLDDGRPRDLALAALVGVVGLYDKLNFVWVLAAFGVALPVAYGRRALEIVRAAPRPHLVVLGAAALAFGWMAYGLIVPALALPVPGAERAFDAAAQWEKLVDFYDDTFAATFARSWMTEHWNAAPTWPFRLLVAELAALAAIACARPWRDATLDRRFRASVFFAVAIVLMAAQMWATKQLAGPHHLVAIWPLPTLLLLLEVDLGARLLARSPRVAPLALAVAAAALVLVGIPANLELRALWRGEFGFRSPLEPATPRLAEALKQRGEGHIMATDWGLIEPLVMLAPKSQRARYVDGYVFFMDPYESDVKRNQWVKDAFFPHGTHWLVAYAEGREVMTATRGRVAEFVAHWGGCLTLDATLNGDDGRALYRIWRYDADSNCAQEPRS